MKIELVDPMQTLEYEDDLLTQEITLQLQQKVSSELKIIGTQLLKLLNIKKKLIKEIADIRNKKIMKYNGESYTAKIIFMFI